MISIQYLEGIPWDLVRSRDLLGQWGFSPSAPNAANLNSDARESFEFYQQAGAENLFWLDKPIFHTEWQVVIQPILKEGELESLRQWGIEKPFGVVRTKEDIRKIYQLVEMASREFEYGDTIEVPALPTLEEQFQSMKAFLWNLPYFYMGPKEHKRQWLAKKAKIRMDGQSQMDGAIYVVGPNIGAPIGYGDVGDFSAYTPVAALVSHIATRLRNNHASQMYFCTNLVNHHQIPKVAKPHQFYKEADALPLFGSLLPLVLIYEKFEFLIGELEYATLWQTDTPTRVLTPQDVMKVWQLFEIAVRDFIESSNSVK